MPNKNLFSAVLMSFVLLISSSVWAEVAVEEQPVLPKDVLALPPELDLRMKDLIKAAEKFRGLPCLHAVPYGALGELGLKRKMVLAFQEELPAEKMAPLEASLKAFGLIPESMVLAKYYPELLTSQVGGFYDPRRKYLTLVMREGGLLGKEASAKYGADVAKRMEETVLVHELTHALQDQHFNLQKFAINDPLSDEGAARLALIEGDATLTMYNFFTGMNLENMPGMEQMMTKMFEDPQKLMDMSADMPGGKEMADAPAWFRDNLLFSYLQGYVFCMNVKKKGGQKLLDYAFTKDPPRSTEQILHPEKWHTKRDDPVAIVWPDLSNELPGYKKVAEAQLGEQSIKVLLRGKMKNEKQAAEAAAGWGGDRFAVYQRNDSRVLLWITEWDSNQDSRKFKEAAAALGEDWNVEQSRPSRVQLIRGNLEPVVLMGVKRKLAEAEAKVPENKPIDLAALGIVEPKNGTESRTAANAGGTTGNNGNAADTGGLDLGELMKNPAIQKMAENMLKGNSAGKDGNGNGAAGLDIGELLKDPNIQKMAESLLNGTNGKAGGGLDLGEIMKNPAIQKMAENMLKGNGGKDGNASGGLDIGELLKDPNILKMAEEMLGGKAGDTGGLDIGKMMQNPMVKSMLDSMQSQQGSSPGKISADGRAYTNEQLGFAIKLPESGKDWNLDPKPAIPMTLVLLSDPLNQIKITVQTMPIAIPIDSAELIEMGPKMALQNYKKISGGEIESGQEKIAGETPVVRKGYELQYEGVANGQKLRFTQRYFAAAGTTIVVTAAAPAESFASHEKLIGEAIQDFSLIEVKKNVTPR